MANPKSDIAVISALQEHDLYSLHAAAEMLGINFRTLRDRMQWLGIQPYHSDEDKRVLLLTGRDIRELMATVPHRRKRAMQANTTYGMSGPGGEKQEAAIRLDQLGQQITRLNTAIESLRDDFGVLINALITQGNIPPPDSPETETGVERDKRDAVTTAQEYLLQAQRTQRRLPPLAKNLPRLDKTEQTQQ